MIPFEGQICNKQLWVATLYPTAIQQYSVCESRHCWMGVSVVCLNPLSTVAPCNLRGWQIGWGGQGESHLVVVGRNSPYCAYCLCKHSTFTQ